MKPDGEKFKSHYKQYRKILKRIVSASTANRIKALINALSDEEINFILDGIYFVISGHTPLARSKFVDLVNTGLLGYLQKQYSTAAKVSRIKKLNLRHKKEKLFLVRKAVRGILSAYL